MSILRNLVMSKDSTGNFKVVPWMTQAHFITLWRMVYYIFDCQNDDDVSIPNNINKIRKFKKISPLGRMQ